MVPYFKFYKEYLLHYFQITNFELTQFEEELENKVF